jgi:uncharacterized membrane protein YhhN
MAGMALPRPSVSSLASAGYATLAAVDSTLAASSSAARRRFRMVTKPLLMPALATAFVTSLGRNDVRGGGVLAGGTVTAQALSGAGDIALLSRSEPAFLAGLGSFLGAHVAYTTAFVSAGRPLRDLTRPGGTVGAAALFATLAPVVGRAAGRRSARLRAPVVVYAGGISSMFAASTRLNSVVPAGVRRTVVAGTALFVAGTALFVASDTLLAAREFMLPRPAHPGVDAAVMVTYTLGQGLIAAGISQALRSRGTDATSDHHTGGGGVEPSFPWTVPPAAHPGPSTRVE